MEEDDLCGPESDASTVVEALVPSTSSSVEVSAAGARSDSASKGKVSIIFEGDMTTTMAGALPLVAKTETQQST